MEYFDKITEKLKKHISAEKSGVLLGLILAGAALMLLPQFFADDDSDSVKSTENVDSIDSYCTVTESRLEQILSQVEGVGRAHVMVTLENGVEYRYAADEKQSGDSVFTYASGSESPSKVQEKEDREQSYILIGSSGDKRPLVVTELSPRVRGVVVVCEGAKNPVIRQRVSDAVTTALGINSLQVCVIQSA
ncbi:MAG: hypothetical protein J6A76_04495 [Oscillospiraceae bacterium]|nr:hypothetical protein [Oscillospiraceae bacterium]